MSIYDPKGRTLLAKGQMLRPFVDLKNEQAKAETGLRELSGRFKTPLAPHLGGDKQRLDKRLASKSYSSGLQDTQRYTDKFSMRQKNHPDLGIG